MTTPRLVIPEIAENQASKYITHNEALRVVDALVQTAIQSVTNTAPGSPADGQCWIVGTSPTGDFAGKANQIAQRYNGAWYFHAPLTGWKVYNVATGLEVFFNGTTWVNGNVLTCLPIAVGDETTALTAGTAKVTFRMPFAMTLTSVRASVTTAPTGSVLTVDINENGTSILSTKLTIDATEKTSTTAAIPPVISDSSLADDAEITIDIDGVGSTVAGAGLKVYLIGRV